MDDVTITYRGEAQGMMTMGGCASCSMSIGYRENIVICYFDGDKNRLVTYHEDCFDGTFGDFIDA